ncbi:Acl-9 [Aphelenchoides bicaudatus]|nr:Acl-9 [Aphelenchoides bicaudatus]
MFGRFDGIVFGVLLFLSSLLGSIFLLVPILPLSFFAPRTFRRVADRLIGYWLTFPASLIFFIFRVKIYVTGDLIKRDEPSLIIMNHRTRLDWLFFWNCLYRMDPYLLTQEKIVLKAPLKSIPGAGYSMSGNCFLFLQRSMNADKRLIEHMLNYYKDTKFNYQILLFPEGTDRGERATSISHAFADTNNLPRYDYVLHPRTTGFNLILNQMRKNDYIRAVYDVTLGYPQHIVESEKQLIKEGRFPEAVCFDVKRYSVDEVCGEEADKTKTVDASQWLTNLWKTKEHRLKEFYTGDKQFKPSGDGYKWPVTHFAPAYFATFVFWSASSVFWIWLICTSFYIKLYVLACIAFFTWTLKAKGGLEFLILEFFYGRRFSLIDWVNMAEPRVITETTLFEKLRGWLFSLAMLTSAFFGTIYILMPLLALIFVRPKIFRKLVDRLVGFWLTMPSGLMEYLFGIELVVRGSPIRHKAPALIIMNHRTRLDWLFFWNALFRIDPMLLTSNKISLKGMLRFLPGAGFAMACNAFIFLYRQFDKDKDRIDKLVEYYANSGQNYQILLFPEGTDKCPLATGRSKKHAENKQLVHYDYLLHPRLSGFAHFLQQMRKHNYIEYVYDCTVAYPEEIVQSEVDLFLLGACPKKIHFDIRTIDVKSLPDNEKAIGEWLTKLWADKEERLRKFYDKPIGKREFDSLQGDVEFKMSLQTMVLQFSITSIWCIMTCLWYFVFFTYPYQFLLATLTLVFFYGCQYFLGGLEMLLTSQLKQPALGHLFGNEDLAKKVS